MLHAFKCVPSCVLSMCSSEQSADCAVSRESCCIHQASALPNGTVVSEAVAPAELEQVVAAVAPYWAPCGLVAPTEQSSLLSAAQSIIAALHAAAPRMPAPPVATTMPGDVYGGRHPRCALLATVQLLLGLARNHDNATQVRLLAALCLCVGKVVISPSACLSCDCSTWFLSLPMYMCTAHALHQHPLLLASVHFRSIAASELSSVVAVSCRAC